MEHLYTAGLVVAGVVNAIPASGAFSAAQLERLYGMPFSDADPNTLLLMRHRAVLFGIVGGLCFTAAAKPQYRPVALAGGLTSMVSYVVLGRTIPGEKNSAMQRVAKVDIVATALLALGWFLGGGSDHPA